MSFAQTSSLYSVPYIPISPSLHFFLRLCTAILILSLSLSITRRKDRSSPFAASYNGFDGYISLIVRAGLATIIARCQYLRKPKIDENIADLKRNLDLSLQGCGATYYRPFRNSCPRAFFCERNKINRINAKIVAQPCSHSATHSWP